MTGSCGGWFAYDPSDPASFDALTADQKAKVVRFRPPQGRPPAARAEITLYSLSAGAGAGVVGVTTETGASERDVLEAAIRELTAARELFE